MNGPGRPLSGRTVNVTPPDDRPHTPTTPFVNTFYGTHVYGAHTRMAHTCMGVWAHTMCTFCQDEQSSDDEYDDLLNEVDNDPEMEQMRNIRMQHMRQQAGERAENLAKGHGQYRHISQDEFLTEVTASKWCAIHFFHKEFERCKILHHHLDLIAPHHVECKFLQIDAEKCPFFISKLQIQMLPCLIVFKDGVVVDRLTGFEALADPEEPDKWHTSRLQAWIASCGAIKYQMPNEEMRKEMKKMGIVQRGTIWSENRAHDSESDDSD